MLLVLVLAHASSAVKAGRNWAVRTVGRLSHRRYADLGAWGLGGTCRRLGHGRDGGARRKVTTPSRRRRRRRRAGRW